MLTLLVDYDLSTLQYSALIETRHVNNKYDLQCDAQQIAVKGEKSRLILYTHFMICVSFSKGIQIERHCFGFNRGFDSLFGS